MRFILSVLVVSITMQAQDDMARARRISAEAIGIDSHIDTIQHVLVDGVDLANRLPNGMVDFPRLREGGMKAPFFALWVPVYYKGAEAVRRKEILLEASGINEKLRGVVARRQQHLAAMMQSLGEKSARYNELLSELDPG